MSKLTDSLVEVQPEVAEKLLRLQTRCINCPSTFGLQIHHRVFRSEGEEGVRKLFEEMYPFYEQSYKRPLKGWGLHDIQNLCVLCLGCHEGEGTGVHGGNESLRQKLRHSFTDSTTGFNIPFYKQTK